MSDDIRNIILGSLIVLVSIFAQYFMFILSRYLFGA